MSLPPGWEGLDAEAKRKLLARLLSQKEQTPVFPLSHGQEALFFLHRMAPDSVSYNVAFTARLHSPADVAALERAFSGVVARHEMLRVTFEAAGNEPLQRIHDSVPVRIEEIDGRASTPAEVLRSLSIAYKRPFDLEKGPLFRLTLVHEPGETSVLMLVIHHIVFDGSSMGVLLSDWFTLYAAEVSGMPAALPPLQSRYSDFVRWQADFLKSSAGEAMWAYWQRQLAAPLPTLDLPLDHPRPAVQTFRGATHTFQIEAEIAQPLRELARQRGATLYMALLAAFQVLLQRYTAQDDIVMGSPTAGRSQSEFAGLVGYFVNPVVLRGDLSGNPTFLTCLDRVRTTVVEALRNADYSFPLLVKRLRPERDPSRSPVFQVEFNLVKADVVGFTKAGDAGGSSRMTVGGVQMTPFVIEQQEGQFDFGFDALDSGGSILANFKYATDLFAPATVERMAGHLRVLLRAIGERPGVPVSELAMLTEPERIQAVSEWNPSQSYPKGLTLHQRFEQQVARTPDAVAVVCEAERLTYAELNRRANQLAHRLRGLGVGPDRLVGLRIERTLDIAVGIVGILKAGGAYLPLDPAYPRDRVDFMLQDSRTAVVVTQKSLAGELEGVAATRVLLDEPFSDPDTNPAPVSGPDDLAYVIYTSGSTGTPKGVQISHDNVTRLFDATADWYAFGADDVWSLFHSYAFDFSVWELWGALLYGGRLVVVPYWVSRSPEAFRELLVREGVTVLNQTPAAFRQLVQADLALPPAAFALRYVVFGGEALELQSLRPWFDRYGDEKPLLVNMYGITETTVHVTYRPIRIADLDAGAGSVIGVPIPDLQLYVLDVHGQIVPIGVAGEMYVGGAGVARGYLNRPELSAERFIPDPFRAGAGRHLYRSGDLARRLPNGDLEYLGRIDHQVKIRGFRIELGEIEAAIAQEVEVREVIVLAREDVPGDRRLVAYVVTDGPRAALVEALRGRLRDRLPEYMVPAHFVLLEAFPLTPNGKVDRKALPVPERSAQAASVFVAPRTPTEEILAGIFEEVLKVERVGVEDDFFDLGGHSLLATQLMSRVRRALGVDLPLRDLFNGPTVAGLAARVQGRGPTAAVAPLVAGPREGPAQLSRAQQRLWFLDQIEPGSGAYVIAGALSIRGPLVEASLERALGTVVARHDALRTTFASVQGRPRAVVAPVAAWSLPQVDLSSETDAESARRVIAKEAQRPFDLAAGPLFRAVLYRLGPEEHALLLSMHHIVSDGWSLGLLVDELGAAYTSTPLPALPVQYQDYALWQHEHLEALIEQQLSYWRTQLTGAPAFLALPTDRPRPPVESHRGATLSVDWPSSVSDRLRSLARREGATLFMTLLAAFQVVLSRHSGQEEVVVGSPVANRSRPEVEDLIGMFVNTLVLRTDLSGNPTYRELLARVREACLGAWAHADMPFEKLVEELKPERDASRNPLFQVAFVLQNVRFRPLELPGLAIAPYELERTASQVDLSLHVWETKEGLHAVFEYVTDLFDASTIERLGGHLGRVLEGIAAEPEKRLSELPLLTAEEEALFARVNATRRPYPAATVHDLIAQQARRTPDRVAAECGGSQLTYGELEERTARLAAHLRGLGARRDVLVGIFMERSLDMLVGVLAVLRSGAAYVPLDPAYPADRLAYMVEDSGARILLTQTTLLGSLPSEGRTVVCMDAEGKELGAADGVSGAPSAPDDLAYVIYTSGSTGRPKGVAITHRSLVNLLVSMGEEPGLRESDVLLSVTTLSFDIAGLELYLPLLKGARLVLLEREEAADGRVLRDRIGTSGATIMQATPATWRLLLEAGWPGTPGLKVLCGGEALPRDLANALQTKVAEVWNVYGPTETTIWSSAWRVSGEDGPVPIGHPIANTTLYILDQWFSQVPMGVPGELFIGGHGLARGYWQRPELTAEKFLPDPFSSEPGARMYRTGDLARWRPDGTVECLGRLDHQVKVRGFRIELGEIEAALRQHPGVQEAAVLAQDVAGGDRRLVAYLSHGAEPQPNVTALRNHTKTLLPAHMVPSSFVFLDRLPLTPNGKLDRKALAQLETGHPGRAKDAVPPRTPTEKLIAGLWREALSLPSVSVRDNFFDLGGHSLLAMRVLAAIEKETGNHLHPRAIIFQTLEQIAASCEDKPTSLPVPAPPRSGPMRRLVEALRALFGRARTPDPNA
jgi:amino acid adenylation domain-containing protein